MIIGNGNIAKALIDREDVIFFASGVSDSSCNDFNEFQRELTLLLEQDRNKHLVYFSSLSIYRSDSPYNEHKKTMELAVKENFPYYTIVRVEVCAWARNPTTIHNVFRNQLSEGCMPEIQPTFRYVVTLDEFQYWLSLIPTYEQSEMNIPGIRYSIREIYNMVKEGKL